MQRGAIHAICGENGAGKSTLMKVLSGVHPHGSYEGDIVFEGEPVTFKDIRQSEAAGIVIIHQELALIPELSIAENIFLGNETATRGVINWDQANHRAIELMARVGLRENPLTPVKHLGIGKQQLVEIAKALSKEVKLLILDEPTAALNDDDSTHLLDLLKGLQGKGITSIMISHKLNEIERIADAITILRDGRTIETLRRQRRRRRRGPDHPRAWSDATSSTGSPTTRPQIGEVLFEVRDWTVMHPQDHSRVVIQDANLDGQQGRDRRHRRPDGRRPHRAGPQHLRPLLRQPPLAARCSSTARSSQLRSVHDAIRAGIAYVSEDRKGLGLNLLDDIKTSITSAGAAQAPQGPHRRRARGGRGRRALPQELQHQGAQRHRRRPQAVGRQPAEGRAQQVDVHRAAAADPRRADARHRRRRQVRDLRHHPGASPARGRACS